MGCLSESSFHLDWVQFLAENRTGAATVLFRLFSFIGEIEGFVLVVALIYVAYDKRLAFRLSVLVLVTMSLNHLLKTLIANPRPFVPEGTFAERWAISEGAAQELAREYSTPSGHAMAGSCFYSYLCARVRHKGVRTAAILALLLAGLSRPYLGMHYVEDVLLGWALGIPIALLAARTGDRIGRAWNRLSLQRRISIIVAASIVLWLVTRSAYASSPLGPPLPFVSYAGFLAGIVVAYPLEARWVNFDPRSSTATHKLLRYAISVALVLGTLVLLEAVSGLVAEDASVVGNLLRYLRYVGAGIAGMLLGPFLFVRLGLAKPA